MPNIHEKRALLRALQSGPDFLGLAALPLIQAKEGRELLRWLDQSGLALSFLRRISARGEGADIPSEWRDALERRRERNAIRMLDMLEEFRRLNEAFRAQGILTVTLKGFSLVPDFCEDPCDRHQTDFDLLVEPANVEGAAEVLQSLGYSTARLSRSEESCFTTPLRHIPSYKDDLYAVQHHRQVDLHVSLSDSSSWTELDVPGDCMLHAEPLTLCGVNFHAVSLADRFLGQVLHAFRHSFRSWIRLSWLMEIGRCMDLHGENEDLWGRVVERAGDRLLSKRVFAFVLSLTNRLFRYRIPWQLRSWAAEGMRPSLRAWLDHFSVRWAIADWPGNLGNLFLAPEFIPDRKLRRQYVTSRLLPKRAQMSIGTMARGEKNKSVAWNLERWQYVAHRSGVHCRDLFRLPWDQLRWKRALAAVNTDPCGLES